MPHRALTMQTTRLHGACICYPRLCPLGSHIIRGLRSPVKRKTFRTLEGNQGKWVSELGMIWVLWGPEKTHVFSNDHADNKVASPENGTRVHTHAQTASPLALSRQIQHGFRALSGRNQHGCTWMLQGPAALLQT